MEMEAVATSIANRYGAAKPIQNFLNGAVLQEAVLDNETVLEPSDMIIEPEVVETESALQKYKGYYKAYFQASSHSEMVECVKQMQQIVHKAQNRAPLGEGDGSFTADEWVNARDDVACLMKEIQRPTRLNENNR